MATEVLLAEGWIDPTAQPSEGAEQGQQALEVTSRDVRGVELEGKSASIESNSDTLQSRKECCLLSQIAQYTSSSFLCSAAGYLHQLSINKNERKRESDKQDVSQCCGLETTQPVRVMCL
jgi:hypothetical protein